MSFASKYNKTAPRWAVKLVQPAYTTLADLYAENGAGYVYPICAVYINTKGHYGPQPCVAISESMLVNLPPHLLEVCTDMRSDPEAVEQINAGLVGFKIYTYDSKARKGCYSVEWVDIND